ncbi:ketosamine-3-kinase [Deinococcus cavernae]|uniref:Ketosamine-3-kinase n=2 Tax=Deinococcus cavernae TaxID=2320857 RepID=A0A418V975_9DEIO|nr:ketosamine-3-kinase [Deinococcus cavernae]
MAAAASPFLKGCSEPSAARRGWPRYAADMLTSLPPAVKAAAQSHLGSRVTEVSRLSGGDISAAFRVVAGHGQFVVKVRPEQADHPALFHAEALGLHLLGQQLVGEARAVVVPQVVGYGLAAGGTGVGQLAYLVMNFLEPAPETPQAQEALGRGLAALHRTAGPQFGGTPDNFVGFLPQKNPPTPTAAEFFWAARLAPQLKRAQDHLSAGDIHNFEALRERLPGLIPPEAPALVHGDLWRGNMLFTALGPALIDPAATYSHREVDLSLMRLFGGVSERVFAAYAEAFPPAEGWEQRADLWNLYPLLAHLNMFGDRYLGRLQAALHAASNMII